VHALDSAAMALTNMSNSDTHIVRLREKMARPKLRLFLASKKEWTSLIAKIIRPSPEERKIIKYLWLDVALRRLYNIRKGTLFVLHKQRPANRLTKTMRHLCPSIDPRTSLPFDQLPNKTIMMLSRLVSNEQKLLVRGELAPHQTKYPACKCTRDPERGTSSTLLHRITVCPYSNKAAYIAKAKEVIMGTDKSVSKTDILRQLTSLAI